MGVTMRSSLGLSLLLLFASVAPMHIKALWIPPDCTTCPNETTCCPDLPKGGKAACCPVGNDDYQCCPIENGICCPDWDGPGLKCCSQYAQCAPNGHPDGPCMAQKPMNVTFFDGLNLSSSFPASDV